MISSKLDGCSEMFYKHIDSIYMANDTAVKAFGTYEFHGTNDIPIKIKDVIYAPNIKASFFIVFKFRQTRMC